MGEDEKDGDSVDAGKDDDGAASKPESKLDARLQVSGTPTVHT